MNTMDLLRGPMIENISFEELSQVLLTPLSGNVSVRTKRNGLIVLTDNRIVKCVSEYYQPVGEKPIKASGANPCHKIHKGFAINNVPANSCELCHLQCMAKQKEGLLQLTPKKTFTKR